VDTALVNWVIMTVVVAGCATLLVPALRAGGH
jgi:hypothetical protein